MTDRTFTTKDERAFLLDLYQETGGPKHWNNRSKWNVSGIHHCQWFGIQCYPNNTYVKWIDMIRNNVVGTPSNLWKFRNLQGICFSGNKNMTGHISSIVFSNMTRLRRLSLSFSQIYGEIPWNVILKLENLEKLQLCCTSHRRLTGKIPQDIGKLSKLQVFSIGENDIWGPLPKSISNLTKLWFLDLEYARLTTGDLSYLSNMTNLISLHMTNCKFKGTLPKNFGTTHPNLEDADLSSNRLEGELNQSLVGLYSLQHLSLSRNQWHGLLPKSLGYLQNLRTLDVSHNYFSGFEEDMTFNAQLEILYLNGNQNMTCDVKHLLAALQPSHNCLRVLNASDCGLSGKLTAEIWKMELLIYLDLSNNHLSGVIPVSDHYLAYLIQLSLSSNNFSGYLDINLFVTNFKVLRYLGIQGNSLLRSHNTFLSYMEPDYKTVTHQTNFSCPSVHLTATGGNVDMDPSLYDYTLCFCDQGFYGYSNNCLRCMEGGRCVKDMTPLETRTGTVTKENNAMQVKMAIQRGYWPCCNGFEDVQRLVKCNKKQTFDYEVCSPSGDCECSLEVSTGRKLKTSCNSSCICHHGNSKRFCSKCIHGFYKRGGVCVRCPEFRKNFPVITTVCFVVCLLLSVVLLACFRSYKRFSLVFMFLLVTTLTVLHFMYIIPGWFFIIIFGVWILGLSSQQKDNEKSLQGFICIAVFFFQSLDAMLSEAKIWPRTIILLKYKITNVFNFEIAELTCSFSGAAHPEINYAILLLLPVGGIVGIWFLHLLGKTIGCFGIKSSTCKRLTIEILLLLYFPITAKTFDALSPCTDRDGLSYLRDAPWLDCHGTSYNWLVSLGFGSLAIFVVGIPTFVFAPLLFCHLDHDGRLASEEADTWLKPFYGMFTSKHRRYFPLVFLSRRLLLAVSLSLIPTSSCYQILTITFVLIVFIAITFVARPYEKFFQRFEFENMADIVVSVVLLLSFVGLESLRNASTLNYSLVWLILSLNFIIMFCCIGGTLILFAVNFLKAPEAENDAAGYEQLPDQQK